MYIVQGDKVGTLFTIAKLVSKSNNYELFLVKS